MANKIRGKGEGSICPLPSGSYRAQISLQGRRISHTAKTRRECQDWIRKMNNQIDDGMNYDNSRILIKDYLSDWLKNSKPSYRSKTWKHFEQLIRDYINPQIGSIKLIDLRPEHIQRLYNFLLEHNIGAYTILKVHSVLHNALSHAVKLGTIPRNPASVVKTPKEPSKEMQILDENQVSQLLLSTKNHRLGMLIYLAMSTGMRQMELLGLKWSDIDWVKHTIRVERQLVRPEGKGVQFAPLKTKSGRRSIDISPRTIEALREHYNNQHLIKQSVGTKWQENDLIFTNSFGGPINPRNLLRDFKKLLQDAGLPPIRWHDLRHTTASIWLNQGIPVLVVSKRLGHSRPSITLDIYAHLIPNKQTELAEMIDELIMPIELHTTAHELHTDIFSQELTPKI